MTVAARDLRNHYGELLRRAEAGERIDIVRDGKVVATLGPPARRAATPIGLVREAFQHLEAVDADTFFDDLYGPDGIDGDLRDPFGPHDG